MVLLNSMTFHDFPPVYLYLEASSCLARANHIRRYLRYEHVSASTRLRVTETEASNAFAGRASFGIEVGHLAYTGGC